MLNPRILGDCKHEGFSLPVAAGPQFKLHEPSRSALRLGVRGAGDAKPAPSAGTAESQEAVGGKRFP